MDTMGLARRNIIEVKCNMAVQNLTSIVMKNYNVFYDELQSDIALSIIICARTICGIHNDTEVYTSLLEKLDFEKWSKQTIKEHLHNITNAGYGGCLAKLMKIFIKGSYDLSENESFILIKNLNIFIDNANMIIVEKPKREEKRVSCPSELRKKYLSKDPVNRVPKTSRISKPTLDHYLKPSPTKTERPKNNCNIKQKEDPDSPPHSIINWELIKSIINQAPSGPSTGTNSRDESPIKLNRL